MTLNDIFRHENKDSDSDFFDYKWTLKTKHLSRFRLHDCQYINHFRNSFACLTTKVGLITVCFDQCSFCIVALSCNLCPDTCMCTNQCIPPVNIMRTG